MAGTNVGARNVTHDSEKAKPIPEPSRATYRAVLGALRHKYDLSLSAWCVNERIDRDKVRAALLGMSRNEEARDLFLRAVSAAGLIEGGDGR